MVLGVDPKVDYAFKRVFGDERNADILMHLVNSILQLSQPITRIEILNPFNEKDYTEDKMTVLDIKAQDEAGRRLNVEMQMLLLPHFRSRILYYWAGLYRQQIGEGDPYGELRPAVSICLLNQVLFTAVDAYHLAFRLRDAEHGIDFSDDLQIHLLELPKFGRRADELQQPLEKWLYFFQSAETMDLEQWPAALDEPIYRRAARELAMLTQDEKERERYESRQKAYRDHISALQGALEQGLQQGREQGLQQGREQGLQQGREQGLQQGREQGLQQGREQGELIGRIHLCEQRLRRPITPREELAALSMEKLGQRAEQLETELFGS